MYSTPGISQSSFSMGLVTRSSTSRAEAPGIWTKMSIMGTMIWGSSSRGKRRTDPIPKRMEAAMIRGVSLESMKARASFPARPTCVCFIKVPSPNKIA